MTINLDIEKHLENQLKSYFQQFFTAISITACVKTHADLSVNTEYPLLTISCLNASDSLNIGLFTVKTEIQAETQSANDQNKSVLQGLRNAVRNAVYDDTLITSLNLSPDFKIHAIQIAESTTSSLDANRIFVQHLDIIASHKTTEAQMYFKVDTEAFNQTMNELIKASARTAYEVVTGNAQNLIKEIAYETDRTDKEDTPEAQQARAGRLQAGWFMSWDGLNLPGMAYSTAEAIKNYASDGDFIDDRGKDDSSVTMLNACPYIDEVDGLQNRLQSIVDAQTQESLAYAENKYNELTLKY